MSKKIDDYVASMELDNSKFEKSAAITMSTLGKLKEKLNFGDSGKGLESLSKAANKVDLSHMSKAVDVVQAKFSALDVVGVTALSNLTNTAVNFGKKMVSSVTGSLFQGGINRAMNIEQAKFQLEGLGVAWEKVSGDIDYAVKGTAYGMDVAAKAASQFVASNVQAGDAMKRALRGISGVAAMTNSSYEDISRIFTKTAGQGRLMGEELLQLSGRGINAAATLGKYLHKSEAEVREMVSKGKIDFNTFASAMDSAFGEHAKDANKTFSGALSNMKASLSRIGADVATPALNNLRDIFNALRVNFDNAHKALKPFIDTLNRLQTSATKSIVGLLNGGNSSWSKLSERVTKAGIPMKDFQKTLIDTAESHGVAVKKMIDESGSFEKSLKKGWLKSDFMVESLKKYSKNAVDASKSTKAMTDKLTTFQKVVNKVWNGDYKNGEERIKALSKAGFKYSEVQNLVNKTVDGHKLTLKDLSKEQLKSVGYTDKEIASISKLAKEAEKSGTPINKLINDLSKPTGKELFFSTIGNVFQPILTILKSISQAWKGAFKFDQASNLYGIIEGLHNLSETFIISKASADKLTRTFRGLFAALDLISMVVGGGFRIAFQIVTKVLTELFKALGFVDVNILTVTASIGDAIVAVRDWVKQHNLLNKAIEFLVPLLVKAVKALVDFVKAVYKMPAVQKGLSKIAKVLVDIGQAIEKYFSGGVKRISEFVDRLKEMDGFTPKNIKAALKDFKDNVLGYFFDFKGIHNVGKNIIDGLVKGIQNGIPSVSKAIRSIGIVLLDTIKSMLGIHSPSTKFIEIGANIISGLCGGLKGGIGTVVNVIKDIVKAITSSMGQIDFGDLFVVGSVAGIIVILHKLTKVMEKFAAPFEKFGHVFDGVSKVLDSFGNTMNAKAKKIKSEALYNIAKAIFVLVLSLALLTRLDQDKLLGAILILGSLAGGLIALMKVSEKMSGPASFGKLSILMISMSAAMLIMSSAIKKLASIEPGRAWSAILEMITIIGALSGLLYMYGTFVKGKAAQNIDKAGRMILKMSIGIAIIAFVMKTIAGLSPDDIQKGLLVIGGVAAIFSAIIFVSKYAGKHADKAGSMMLKMSVAIAIITHSVKSIVKIPSSDIKKGLLFIAGVEALFTAIIFVSKYAGKNAAVAGSMMLKMAIAIGILAFSMKLIAGMSMGEIGKGLIFIAGVEALFTAIILVSKYAGEGAKTAGNMFLKMALAIGILAFSMRMIASLSAGDIAKGLVFIAGVEALFTAIIFVSKYAGRYADKAGTMMLKMSLALGVMVLVVKLAGSLSKSEISKAMKVIYKIGALFGAIIAVSKYAGKYADKAGKMLIKMSAAMLIMVGSIALLTLLDPNKVKVATAAIRDIMGMFAILIGATHFAKSSKGVMVTVLMMTGVVAALGGILYLLSSMPNTDSVLKIAESISVLLGALAVSMFIIGKAGVIAPTALLAMGALTLVVGLLGGILYLLSGMPNADNALKIAESISVLLISMSGVCVVLGVVGLMGPAAFIGIGALVTLIGAMGALMTAIGALVTYIPDLETFLDKGITVLNKIGNGIGSFVGNIVDGFLTSASKSLPTVAKKLSEFMNELKPFLDGASKVDPKTSTAIEAIAKSLLVLTASSFIDGIVSFLHIGTSFKELGTKLADFGEGLQLYSDSVKNVDAPKVKSTADAAQGLAKIVTALAVSNVLNGIADLFGAESKIDMAAFGLQIALFGGGLAAYSKEVENVNSDQIKKSAEAAQGLADISLTLGKKNVLDGLGKLFGAESENLGTFGEKLKSFGNSLAEYSKVTKGIKTEGIKNSVEAAKLLFEMSTKIPDAGNILANWLTGKETLDKFGEKLDSFGTALASYSDKVSGVNSDAIKNSVSAMTSLVDMANVASKGVNTDGINNVQKALKDMVTKEFGKDLLEYSNSVSKLQIVNIDASITAINSLAGMLRNLSGISTSDAMTFASSINILASTNVDGFINTFKDKASQIASVGESITNAVSSGIKAKQSVIKDAMSAAISGMLSAVDNKKKDFNTSGLELMKQLSSGFDKESSKIKTKVISILNTVVSKIRNYYNQFYSAGSYLVDGFSAGIGKNTYKASAKAKAMASAAANAARKELDEHSPSRVGYKIGDYFGIAFVNAIGNYTQKAYKASSEMASSARIGLSNTMGKISDIINSGIETQPTIRPVLDLSNVSSGVGTMNRMFGMNKAIGVSVARAQSINISSTNQNGFNNDVVSAIKDLKNSINTEPNNTYTINGVTYDDGSNVSDAVKEIIRAARIERRK